MLSTLLGSDFGVWVNYGVEMMSLLYVVFEADSHLKLLPTSILYICKLFEHIDMLLIGIR